MKHIVTSKLRKWTTDMWVEGGRMHDMLTEIADAIDQEHETAIIEALNAEGLVRAYDADGEEVFVGDVMVSKEKGTKVVICGVGNNNTVYHYMTGSGMYNRVNAKVLRHVDTPDRLIRDAHRLEDTARCRGFDGADRFYKELHRIIDRAVAMAQRGGDDD